MAYYGARDEGSDPGAGVVAGLLMIVVVGVMVAWVAAHKVGLDGNSIGATLYGFLAPPQFSQVVDNPTRDQPLVVKHPAPIDQVDVAGVQSSDVQPAGGQSSDGQSSSAQAQASQASGAD